MILPCPKDALHKAMLLRLLSGILDNAILSSQLFFKGGTAAAMLGWLNRFSLDLDFDLAYQADKPTIEKQLRQVFRNLNFIIKEKATNELFYVLKYPASASQRQYLKLSIMSEFIKTNQYQTYFLAEINRYCRCQTKETMFANKLVALTDRYNKHGVIAARDLYDIHYFFCQGVVVNEAIIQERLGKSWSEYRLDLIDFVKNKVKQRLIDEDLNFLLTPKQFRTIRTILKSEVITFLYKEN